MSTMDLSQYRQNFQKDSLDDLKDILTSKQSSPIPEGIHEVVVVGVHEKDGQKFKTVDKGIQTLSFSLIIKNAQGNEQMVYFLMPIDASFKQATAKENMVVDKGTKWMISKFVKDFTSMGINPIALREAIIVSNGKALDLLIGAQFKVVNSWDTRMVHLEYDRNLKSHFFVNGFGERFTSGQMAEPQFVDSKIPIAERYKEFVAIAQENAYQFAQKMNTSIEPHPTASNDDINESLIKAGEPTAKRSAVVNKTIPPFPAMVKKPTAAADIQEDIEW